jgi:hypothetical protein
MKLGELTFRSLFTFYSQFAAFHRVSRDIPVTAKFLSAISAPGLQSCPRLPTTPSFMFYVFNFFNNFWNLLLAKYAIQNCRNPPPGF